MEVLPCGHVAHKGNGRLCRHLFGEDSDGEDRVWLLTGKGLDRDVACTACDESGEPVELLEACEGCVERAADDLGVTAIRGEPGIGVRDEPLAVETRRTRMPDGVVDAAAVPDRPATWLLLTSDRVLRWNADTGEVERETPFDLTTDPSRAWAGRKQRHRLHASAGGRFAAVGVDYGQHGLVLDLDTARVTMDLDRGTYHQDTVPFPLAFLTAEDGPRLVHGTAWNRIDVSDPATGELLTAREFTSAGNEPPAHYSGYFQGRLHPSRSGQYLGLDGWVWSPAGLPTVFDLRRWLRVNRFEPEDGPSLLTLAQRWYLWDTPMCWTDDEHLVVWGIGPDDEIMVPGVRVFDPLTGHEVRAFAGPTGSGALFSAGSVLFSADPGGLTRWDLSTGERTGTVPGFVPAHHHPAGRELVELRDGTMVRWPLPD
jgi:hypothetical protein